MTQKILSVFGDELFPKWGKGMSAIKREKAVNAVIEFFRKTQPELVYVMPTKGTASIIPLILKAAKIPYILISPYPGFFNGVSKLDKICIKQATTNAKSFIIVNDAEPDNIEHSEEIWDESVDFMCSVSNAVVFMFSKDSPREYHSFIDKVVEKNSHRGAHMWELIYDDFSREPLSE